MTVIAMTREIGSLGTDVAAEVAKELNLSIVDSEDVATLVAGRMGIEEGTIRRYADGSASILERWLIDRRKLSHYTSEEVLRLAQEGNVLIRGWGAATLLHDMPHVISVRVCAPMAFRVRVMMRKMGISNAETVRQEIERFDTAHARVMRGFFNVEPDAALLYHIILNTGRVPIDNCVKAVLQLAQSPQFQDEAAMKSAAADKLLETKVRATLVENFGSQMIAVTVSAANGRVMLDGASSNGGLRARAERLARGIEGVLDVSNRIHSIRSHGRI